MGDVKAQERLEKGREDAGEPCGCSVCVCKMVVVGWGRSLSMARALRCHRVLLHWRQSAVVGLVERLATGLEAGLAGRIVVELVAAFATVLEIRPLLDALTRVIWLLVGFAYSVMESLPILLRFVGLVPRLWLLRL